MLVNPTQQPPSHVNGREAVATDISETESCAKLREHSKALLVTFAPCSCSRGHWVRAVDGRLPRELVTLARAAVFTFGHLLARTAPERSGGIGRRLGITKVDIDGPPAIQNRMLYLAARSRNAIDASFRNLSTFAYSLELLTKVGTWILVLTASFFQIERRTLANDDVVTTTVNGVSRRDDHTRGYVGIAMHVQTTHYAPTMAIAAETEPIARPFQQR